MSNIVLIHGDCLIEMKNIPDKSVDMILCDLPYGTTSCKWDIVIPFDKLWEQYKRIIKDNGAILIFGSQPFSSVLGASQVQLLQYSWCWKKHMGTGHLNAKKRPLKSHEDILVFYKKQPVYNPQGLLYSPKVMMNSDSDCQRGKENKTSTVSGGLKKEYTQEYTNYPKDVLEFRSENGNKLHPTKKPESILEYLIKTYTNEGELVLDNCMGSGSTGVACLNTNRSFIGIEKEKKYFETAKSRIEETKSKLNEVKDAV